jgi:hypothetical protein
VTAGSWSPPLKTTSTTFGPGDHTSFAVSNILGYNTEGPFEHWGIRSGRRPGTGRLCRHAHTQVSPLQSPLTTASPVETPTGPLISPTLDLANVALRPADMESLFKTTYFVSQPYTRIAMVGLLVT